MVVSYQTYVHTRKKAFTREWQWDVQLSANTSYAAHVCHCNVHRLLQRTVVTTTTTTTIPENSRACRFFPNHGHLFCLLVDTFPCGHVHEHISML